MLNVFGGLGFTVVPEAAGLGLSHMGDCEIRLGRLIVPWLTIWFSLPHLGVNRHSLY